MATICIGTMASQELIENEKKSIVSMRLNDNDRIAIRAVASRLFVRESELYRFAVNHLLNRLQKLHDENCTGSDLLPMFIQFKEELILNLGMKRQQLYKIVNDGNSDPDKFVAMADIELLLLPQHLLRKRLLEIEDAIAVKQLDAANWLEVYFAKKYGLAIACKDESQISDADARNFQPPVKSDSTGGD